MTQPAGWYADPNGLPARRWWDGTQWTDHIHPGGDPTPPPNGYFPPVPPSGPAAPGPHTSAPADPEKAPLYATRPAASRARGGPYPLTENRPAGPPSHPEVPTEPYAMPPVDAVAQRSAFSIAVAPEPDEARNAGWRRLAGPVALAVIAALVLTLVAILLAGRGA